MEKQIDTSDSGKAALVFAEAAILFAKVSGYNAENMARERRGENLAYHEDSYAIAVADFYSAVSYHIAAPSAGEGGERK